MESMPYSTIQKGTFLIATPDIEQGLFFRSVILVCEHNPTGSFGLVINRSLEVELPDEIISLSHLTNPKVGVRAGGPVQTNQMMLLHTASGVQDQKQEMLEICDGTWLGGDLQFLQESIGDVNGPELILCFGYSGWGAGQLEREFLDGSWFLQPATLDYIFHVPPEKLWQTLLRDMGGKYAALSIIPEDLSLN